MKKVGKTTGPFRYDLNQIPYDYTVEVTNRFKGLDLIDRVPEELQTEVHDTVQEAVIKIIPKKKKSKKAKLLSEEALQIAVKGREVKSKGEKESYTHLNAEVQRIDAFELWCWRKLFRVPCTARKSNQYMLKEISLEYSLEGLMLRLKFQYFGPSCEELTHWKRH